MTVDKEYYVIIKMRKNLPFSSTFYCMHNSLTGRNMCNVEGTKPSGSELSYCPIISEYLIYDKR